MTDITMPHIWLPRYNFPGRSRICLPEEKDLRAFFAGLVNTGMINSGHALANAGVIRAHAPLAPPTPDRGWFIAGVGNYQDTAGTTPATANNDPVKRANDQGSGGNNLTEYVSNHPPHLKTDPAFTLNGLPVVQFSAGSTESLASGTVTGISGWTQFIVVYPTSAASIWFSGPSGNGQCWYDATGHFVNMYAGSTVQYSITLPGSTWFYFSFVFNGASSFMYKNGVQVATGNVGAGQQTGFRIGTDTATYFDGYCAEALWYASVLNTADRQQVEAYLAAKYAL